MKQNVKKISLAKINGTKNALITVLLLIFDSHIS